MLLVRSNRYETSVRTIFLKLCQKDNLLQSRETLKLLLIKINFTFSGSQQLLIFRASDNVVPIQQGDTSNVEETSYFIAVFTLHKMFKSIARYVNAAIKQTRDKVGIAFSLWRV